MNMIPDIILRALCWTLLHSLWQGLILAVLAGTILVLTKKASASLRYNLLCCGLILFLATSSATFYLQLQAADGVSQASVSHPAGPVTDGAAGHLGNSPVNVAQPATHPVRDAIESLVGYFNTHAALIVLVWFIVFLARFVRLLSALVYAQRIRYYQTKPAPAQWQERLDQLMHKLRISRPVILLESALIKVPVAVGFLKPAVLVPIGMLAQLPADQVESILLHELAHIRRRDYLFNLVQHVVDTLFFFNPALIWISSLIRTERENCCDDIAIRETRSRRQLIEALVSFHEYRQRESEFAVAFAGSKENQVVQRVKRIVHKTNYSLNAGERAVLMGVLLVLCAAFVTIKHSPKKETVKTATVTPTVTTVTAPVARQKATMRPAPVADTTIKGVKKPADHQPRAAEPAVTNDESSTDESVDTTGATYLGYRNISLDKLIQMKEHGVTADYILSFRKMGYPNITPDQAIELRDHGVTVEFIREFQQMGFKDISLQTAKRLRDHGVTVEYIQSLVNMGYQPIALDQATELRDHGVTTDFISRLNELGFSHISLEKAQMLRDHGVTADYIAACKKRFGKLFELNDYIKLRDAGINPTE
jgi:beta-lactamase regulating signal transducer with metallopeptidase domain